MPLPGETVAAAFHAACLLELEALKPGNVHRRAAGHAMTVAQFEASAAASAPAIGQPGLAVGERIHEAVRLSRAAAGCNTNLGILLLCAPLAQAAMSEGGGALGERLRRVLAGLSVADADFAFRAIRLAAPGGLGRSSRHDVRDPPRVTLIEAMVAARDRDRIAAQYASGFADVLDLGLPRLREALARGYEQAWAASAVYLGFLARFADSHVARKFGIATAEDLRRRAEGLDALLRRCADPAALEPELMAFDAALKAEGLNPGTSADLTVATLFARDLLDADVAAARAP